MFEPRGVIVGESTVARTGVRRSETPLNWA